MRAKIENDLLFERCVFLRADGIPMDAESEPSSLDDSGGIDLRRASIGGQLTFNRHCRIGHRRRPMSGRKEKERFGPAVDAWKASFGLGVFVEQGAEFRGAVFFNGAKFGRSLLFSGSVRFVTDQPPKQPYYVAFTLADAEIDGHLLLDIQRVSGRVSLQRLRVNGSAEFQRIAFHGFLPKTADVQKGSPYPTAPSQSDELPEGFRNPLTYDQTSLLDMQDMTLSGGINIKRHSVSIERAEAPSPQDCPDTPVTPGLWKGRFSLPWRRPKTQPPQYIDAVPFTRFIVDLRGMSCATWDDADATAWKGLTSAAPQPGLLPRIKAWLRRPYWRDEMYADERVPWRLRFEGMQFERLGSSEQPCGIDERTTLGRDAPNRWINRLLEYGEKKLAGHPRLLWPYDHGPIAFFYQRRAEQNRSYMTMRGKEEILRFRLQALESFNHNNWRPVLPLQRRVWSAIVRWTIQSEWRRREIIPALQPQPFDLFARAYTLNGDLATAVGVTRRRTFLQWRKRIRLLSQWTTWKVIRLLPWWLPCAFTIVMWRALWPWAGDFFVITAIFVALPMLGMAMIGLFRLAFGYGLDGFRAVMTAILFPVLVMNAAPWTMKPTVPQWLEPHAHWLLAPPPYADCPTLDVPAVGRFNYGIDKLVPGDGGTLDEDRAAVVAKRNSLALRLSIVERLQQRLEGESKTKWRVVALHELGKVAPKLRACEKHADDFFWRMQMINMVLDVFGWITISLIILTLTGVLRRDAERG